MAGPYPAWNSRSRPSPRGLQFLRSLDELSFGRSDRRTQPLFVDEFELRPRNDDEQGGAPDYAVLWDDRLWLIELKTETSSHRRGQLATYYTLAGHHHPGLSLDLTYLTPPFTFKPPSDRDGVRFAHVDWTQVVPLLREVWARARTRNSGPSPRSSKRWRASVRTGPRGAPSELKPYVTSRRPSRTWTPWHWPRRRPATVGSEPWTIRRPTWSGSSVFA
ncbi:hypothetical protein HII36_11495 [Nonomuraea sp. NN258]|uniref:hypothetical protein n=1 Tax=Nonomuraea antri TaxID=2730852 RepID=UPI001568B943|nr:hypothetical protein [Nonomuraea antri]NRQ32458.1 hypothetical protein [Nonomuraea antri]